MIKTIWEYFKNNIIYGINIIISAFKLRELCDSSSRNFFIVILVFCIIHLISAFLSFSSIIWFKISTLISCIFIITFDILESSKLDKIKIFELEFLKQFYFELGSIPNIIIFYDLYIEIIRR